MDIQPTNAATSVSAGFPTASSGALSSDFDTFLKMLTTQIRNQDPLNPTNPEDFAVQLATFAGVEQQVRTNDLLEQIRQQSGQGSLTDMVQWIGLEVRADMPAELSGSPIDLALPVPLAGERHELVAYDRFGSEVYRGAVDPEEGTAAWPGLDDNGVPLPRGLYIFSLESFEGDSLVSTAPVEAYAPVREVRRDGRDLLLVFDGGVERRSGDISGVRDRDASAGV
ncbi:flagellar hook capping FlgD N-terminal domain-containing protein [Oceaniglobus roseus]|uniref:flagellar hook capping FlgD N-terminal domain-containing protein n=1 Tax=Oceaniglobus roseus TaxID=1737570 RepID=UPI000C7F235D|nr:flagellar hook capping FlgD N-terminal domain-containing protein [Kandeliimicrobium roseum]